MNTKDLILKLRLRPHPEGGYYAETYRSGKFIEVADGKCRNISTAIYYLLENQNKSVLHRILSDELWFFHQGQPLEIVSIRGGELHAIILGNDVEKGEVPQVTIPAYTWFAAKIKSGSGYSLVSCTVAPGFDFSDFELAKRADLVRQYPHLKDKIEEFTR
jgi:uncharacterized protein